jgi:hypothetical protein
MPFGPADRTHRVPVDVKQSRRLVDGVNQVARVLEVRIVAVADAHHAEVGFHKIVVRCVRAL